MIAACVVLLALAPLPGALEEDQRFKEARGLYDGMDLEGALARFELVLLDDSLSREDRATVLLWAGLTQAELGLFKLAKLRFAEALSLDADARMPTEASPKVKQMVEAARVRAKELGEPEEEPIEPPPAADVEKDTDGTVRPRTAGVLIPSSGRARDAYGNEVDPEQLRDAQSSGPPWIWIGAGVVTGAGALGLGGAAAAGALAWLDHDAAVAEPDAKRALGLDQRAQLESIAANVLLISGGVLVAGGIGLAITGAFVE